MCTCRPLRHALRRAAGGPALLAGGAGPGCRARPWFGRWADRLLGTPRLPARLLTAGVVLALAFAAFFQPAVSGTAALLAWAAVALVACYVAFSLLSITHQAWAARLGGGEAAQTRLVAWREGFALLGVIVASVLPTAAGWGVTSAVLAVALAAGLLALRGAPTPRHAPGGMWHPVAVGAWRPSGVCWPCICSMARRRPSRPRCWSSS